MDLKIKRRQYEKERRQLLKDEKLSKLEIKKEIRQFQKRQMKKDSIEVNTSKKEQARQKLRSNLIASIKLDRNVGNSEYYLGCTIKEFKLYIESIFEPGMTWENHGYKGWHLEHIKPLFLYDLLNEEQKKEAGHYTNIRPMWFKGHKLKTRLEKIQHKDKIINPRHIKK
jgi:hypothetical protein